MICRRPRYVITAIGIAVIPQFVFGFLNPDHVLVYLLGIILAETPKPAQLIEKDFWKITTDSGNLPTSYRGFEVN
jgi:hypothetical protein